MNLLFKCTIPGRVGIKKNSKRLVPDRHVILSSTRYITWENTAILHMIQARPPDEPLKCPLLAILIFYFKNQKHEPDLDNMLAGPLDALQKAGIIKNDKQIMAIHAEKIIGDFEEALEIKLSSFGHERRVG